MGPGGGSTDAVTGSPTQVGAGNQQSASALRKADQARGQQDPGGTEVERRRRRCAVDGHCCKRRGRCSKLEPPCGKSRCDTRCRSPATPCSAGGSDSVPSEVQSRIRVGI